MQLGGGSKILSGIKYVYLVFFFALLSGMFYPIITHSSGDSVIEGILILFVGLAGAVSLYKAGTSDKHQKAYLITGFAILAIALVLVFAIMGKV
jgi:small-conductance mechanosensitive channel